MAGKKNKRKKKKKNPKLKKPLTAAQKRARKLAKAERQAKYKWVFMNGKQVRVKRQPTIDGMDYYDFMSQTDDLILLHQEGLWELMPPYGDVPDDEDDLDFAYIFSEEPGYGELQRHWNAERENQECKGPSPSSEPF